MRAKGGRLAFAYRRSRRADADLAEAAALARELDTRLAVVVPFVLPSESGGCCGLRGPKWTQLVREAVDDEARHARSVLGQTAVEFSVTVAEGGSLPEIVAGFAAEGDGVLALPSSASGTLFTRGALRQTERLAMRPVRHLPAA